MGALEFILGLVEALAWPLAILVLVLIFRKRLAELFRAIRRIRLGKLEADLETVKDEAAATIDQLRELAVALAAPAAASLPGHISGRGHLISFSMPDVYERLKAADDIVEALTKLGVAKEEAEELILPPLRDHVRNAHVAWIRELADEAMSPEETNSLLRKKQDYPILDKLKSKEATTTETRSELAKMFELTEEIDERLSDVEHFDRTGSLRRPSLPPWTSDA